MNKSALISSKVEKQWESLIKTWPNLSSGENTKMDQMRARNGSGHLPPWYHNCKYISLFELFEYLGCVTFYDILGERSSSSVPEHFLFHFSSSIF